MDNHVTKSECYKTREAMTNHINNVKTELKEDIANVNLNIAKLPAQIKKEFKNEFAPKWVADVVKFILGAFGLAIIGAIMTLILK